MLYGQQLFNETFWWSAPSFLAWSPCIRRTKARDLLVDLLWPTRTQRQVLILGATALARQVAGKLRRQSHQYQVLGFVNAEGARGDDVVADLDSLCGYLRHNVVDEVILALPVTHSTRTQRAMEICREQGIAVRLHDHPAAPSKTMDSWAGEAKRAMDIAISVIMLVALAPLILATALAVRLTSPGPVFFVQQRVGFGKRQFPLFKFRTMTVDAEAQLTRLEALNEAEGPVFKIADDPRVTPIGKFLRKTSIDELPQLLNVLRGNMSLVGPRPLPNRDVEGFKKDSHRRRFSVKPGLTCLWQVSGRNNISFEKWMELDMDYIDGWSLWLDLKILARTVPAVLKGTGAS